jgi:2'-5' RNA ligase
MSIPSDLPHSLLFAFEHNYLQISLPFLQDQLRSEISRLSSAYPGRASLPFEPHVTLIGAVRCTEEEIWQHTRAIAATSDPFYLSFKDVAHGNIYYQTVFILANKTAELAGIGKSAREKFGWAGDKLHYMPHLR